MMAQDISIVGFGSGKFMVYQLLDHAGTPIYIGQTGDLERRLSEHSKDKPWFHEVKSVWFERVETRNGCFRDTQTPAGWMLGAYEMERARISQFSPRYNQKPGKQSICTESMLGMGTVLPVSDVAALKALAKQRNVSTSTLIRDAVRRWLYETALAAPEPDTATPASLALVG